MRNIAGQRFGYAYLACNVGILIGQVAAGVLVCFTGWWPGAPLALLFAFLISRQWYVILKEYREYFP